MAAAPNKSTVGGIGLTTAATTTTVVGKMAGFNKTATTVTDASGAVAFNAVTQLKMCNTAEWTYTDTKGDTIVTVAGKNVRRMRAQFFPPALDPDEHPPLI